MSAPVITIPSSAITYGLGAAFTFTPTATNTPTSWAATALPPGSSFSTSTGVLTGPGNQVGTYVVSITATNADGTSSAATLTINIVGIPVINQTTSVAGGIQWQTWAYQPYASGNPTSWAAIGLPPGMSLNSSSGLISGAATLPGTYNITLTANNSAGTSAPMTFTAGIAPGSGTNSSSTNRSGIAISIATDTGAVTVGPVVLKNKDDIMFWISFTSGGSIIDPGALTALQIAVKEFEPDSNAVFSGNVFQRVAGTSGSGTLYQLYASISSTILDAELSNYEADSGTDFNATCEIEWKEPNTSGIGPSTLRRSSQLFKLPIYRNVNPT